MANELAILEGDGKSRYGVLFYFPIPDNIRVTVGGSNVVVTPSSELSEIAALVVTQAEKVELDLGKAVFRVHHYSLGPAMTDAEFIDKMRLDYAAEETEVLARYQDAYRYVGERHDK